LFDFYSRKSLESNKKIPFIQTGKNDHLSQSSYLMSLVDRGPPGFLIQEMKTGEGEKKSNKTILQHKNHKVGVN